MYPMLDDLAEISHERLPEDPKEINDSFGDFNKNRDIESRLISIITLLCSHV